MDGGAWQATNHGVAKSQTWLNDFTFTLVINCYNLNIIDTLDWIILCFRVVLCIVSPALQVNSLPPEPWGFSVVLVLKNLPADARDATDTGSLPGNWEDPLEEGMVTHSSILSWTISWTEEPGKKKKQKEKKKKSLADYSPCIWTWQHIHAHWAL